MPSSWRPEVATSTHSWRCYTEVVHRSDWGALPGSAVVRGAETVAAQAMRFADPSRIVHTARVHGAAGAVITIDGNPVSIVASPS